jgi:uncharacterized protein (DUF427 family)
MGLSWQQGPLSGVSPGHFLTATPLPDRLLYVEPLRRRMRVKLAETWIVDSADVLLFHEPARYPVAFFNISDVMTGVLIPENRTTPHRDFGVTAWFDVAVGERHVSRGAWNYPSLPDYARSLQGRIAFAWRGMDAFYEEEERIVGHAADMYHRIDIRQSARRLIVKEGERIIADTSHPLALYESGFAPRWYVPRCDVDERSLTAVEVQTFCPYKGLCSYYDIGSRARAAWSYLHAWPEVARIANFLSFEADQLEISLDGQQLFAEPGQSVVPHGIDRGLDPDEVLNQRKRQQPVVAEDPAENINRE